MKIAVILAFLSAVACVESVAVTCSFHTNVGWTALGNVYTCEVQNDLNIVTRDSAIIESASPSPAQTVKLFHVQSKTVYYFPRNLDKVFPSLEGIGIYYCKLKEVNQDDLRPFTNLKYINLYDNDIEVIEKDLFAYNPHLEYVAFGSNKVLHIDANVFDHLTKLSSLRLYNNKCVDKYVDDDVSGVKALIAELKSMCFDARFATTSTSTTTTTTPIPTTITPPLSTPNYNELMENRMTALEVKLETSIKQSETKLKNELKTELAAMQTGIDARMSALESMTQKILEMVRNLTTVQEPGMHRCDGEWNDD